MLRRKNSTSHEEPKWETIPPKSRQLNIFFTIGAAALTVTLLAPGIKYLDKKVKDNHSLSCDTSIADSPEDAIEQNLSKLGYNPEEVTSTGITNYDPNAARKYINGEGNSIIIETCVETNFMEPTIARSRIKE